MDKITAYRTTLRSLLDWETYLRAESRLPGPRSNLELAQAAAEEASPEQIAHWLTFSADIAPENTPEVFLAVCGTIALGRLLADGQSDVLSQLREQANDPRWRVRESVAMALQRLGDVDMDQCVEVVRSWANGTCLEQRAAAAAICEPRLLRKPYYAQAALELLDNITRSILTTPDRKADDFRTLRQGLAYCWSVAIAALPAEGKVIFARWVNSPDADIRWIIRENLKKNRLVKMDPIWVNQMNQASGA